MLGLAFIMITALCGVLRARRPANLAAERVSDAERRRRNRALEVLEAWLRPELSVRVLIGQSGRVIGAVLAEFGQHLYDDGVGFTFSAQQFWAYKTLGGTSAPSAQPGTS